MASRRHQEKEKENTWGAGTCERSVSPPPNVSYHRHICTDYTPLAKQITGASKAMRLARRVLSKGVEKYYAVPSSSQNMGIRPSAYPAVVLLQPRDAADHRHLAMHEICNAPLRCVTKHELVAGVSELNQFNVGPRGRGCHGHSRSIVGSLPCSLPPCTSQAPKSPKNAKPFGDSRTSALRRS
ncbi:hypothetical protein LX36DRAFT_290406 [Colletotrichum falcatum]|nr:hypothetical protein LX36DRAFT_290406 [Colletotrichum falcatum]